MGVLSGVYLRYPRTLTVLINDTILLDGPFAKPIRRTRHKRTYRQVLRTCLRSYSQPLPNVSTHPNCPGRCLGQTFPSQFPPLPSQESVHLLPPHFDSKFLPQSWPRVDLSASLVFPCTLVPMYQWGGGRRKQRKHHRASSVQCSQRKEETSIERQRDFKLRSSQCDRSMLDSGSLYACNAPSTNGG